MAESAIIEDTVVAINMDGEMRVRLQDWTPVWAYDALLERIYDSRSIDLETVKDGDRLGTAQLDTDKQRINWFNPREP